jgi:prolyl 4-hydroxylase
LAELKFAPYISQRLEERIAKYSQLPKENGEIMYLLRYEVGQEYKPHFDYFNPDSQKPLGIAGNRIATFLMYLADVEEGGETTFPNAAGGALSVKPHKGDAVLFWDYTPDGKPDPLSLHGASKVIKGTKWSLTRWIRERKF